MKDEEIFTLLKFLTHMGVLNLLMLILTGCAAPAQHNTPSGRPEVTINGRVSKAVLGKITNGMINNGYNVKTSTDTLLVFEKPMENFAAQLFLGSRYDSTPAARITYNIIETEGFTRVVASFAAVTNPGSAFERLTPMNNNPDTASYQTFLDKIKNEIEWRQSEHTNTEPQAMSTKTQTTSNETGKPQRRIIGYKVDTSRKGPDGSFVTVPVYEEDNK
jgi:hypothetical protein